MIRRIVFPALAVAACGAYADPLLWWRFDGRYDSSNQTVTNMANAAAVDGTATNTEGEDSAMNGKVCSVGKWGSGAFGALGSDTNAFPVQCEAFPAGTKLYGGLGSGAVFSNAVKTLAWSGDETIGKCGVVSIQKEYVTRVLDLHTFTYEVFFKMPAEAASGADLIFPLVETAQDNRPSGVQGLKLGIKRESGSLYPYFRCASVDGDTEAYRIALESVGQTPVEPGRWHHLALVVDGDTKHAAWFVLDYNVVATNRMTYRGVSGAMKRYDVNTGHRYVYYNAGSAKIPLTVGADIYQTSSECAKSFMGEIAEFRVSDEALGQARLLRPMPAATVDEDTLAFLPMSDGAWFGNPFTAGSYGRYAGILDASPSAVIVPKWNPRSSRQDLEYPAPSGDSPGDVVRGFCMDPNTSADGMSTRLFRTLVNGSAWHGNSIHLHESASGAYYCMPSNSFTVEWFFKTAPWEAGNNGDGVDSYVMLYGNWCKIMIMKSTGVLKTRLVGTDKDAMAPDGYADWDVTGRRVDDGEWHHYALTYDRDAGKFEVYLDYRRVRSSADKATNGRTYSQVPLKEKADTLSFGGMGSGAQTFNGWLDDLRVTRRVLKPHEFVSAHGLVSDVDCMYARFEGDLSSGQDPAVAPDGVSFASKPFKGLSIGIDQDGDGVADVDSAMAVDLGGGNVVYPRNSTLERGDFTAEFFAKISSLGGNAVLLRLGEESELGDGVMSWALFRPGGTSKFLRFAANLSATGAWSGVQRKDIDVSADVVVADGKWHHWAVTADEDEAAGTTTFTLYRDYEACGDPVVFEGGIPAVPEKGTSLSFGLEVYGLYDEMRIRRGVHPPSTFMRQVRRNFMLIVR